LEVISVIQNLSTSNILEINSSTRLYNMVVNNSWHYNVTVSQSPNFLNIPYSYAKTDPIEPLNLTK